LGLLVSVQAAIEAELTFLRAEAEARMVDTFDIKVETGKPAYDPVTKTTSPAYALLFTTFGRVKVGGGLAALEVEAGGRTSVSVRRELHIPVGAGAVPVGAVAFCTAVDETSDPTLLGARLRLSGPAPGSQTTARRLEVSEILT
jgi:hypothetical protein